MTTFNPLVKKQIEEQDKNLVLLEEGVDRLHVMANNINF